MMLERLSACLLSILAPLMVVTILLTGCGKTESDVSSKGIERSCHHLAGTPPQKKAEHKNVVTSKSKKEKKKKCKKCSRNKCICHDNHEEYDAMMEYRAFDLK